MLTAAAGGLPNRRADALGEDLRVMPYVPMVAALIHAEVIVRAACLSQPLPVRHGSVVGAVPLLVGEAAAVLAFHAGERCTDL